MIGQVIDIKESTDVAHARREAGRLAQKMGFSPDELSRIALVVTEAARNILKHTDTGGRVVLSPAGWDAGRLDILTLDLGGGIADIAASLRDGHSTAGGPGTGLGAIYRAADAVDIASARQLGTGLLARFWPGGAPVDRRRDLDVGAVAVPYPGETVSGDAWALRFEPDALVIGVIDGLGHGPEAADAATAGRRAFVQTAGASPEAIIVALHDALQKTRGAAVAAARIDTAQRQVAFAGIGNIGAAIVSSAGRHNLVSHNGIVGGAVRRVHQFTYEWPAAPALLVMHSDGLSERWDLERYPGALARDPALIAGLLYRDHGRARDDATVAVVRQRRSEVD